MPMKNHSKVRLYTANALRCNCIIMDNQTTYNEAMAKLAEAQKCQDEIVSGNKAEIAIK